MLLVENQLSITRGSVHPIKHFCLFITSMSSQERKRARTRGREMVKSNEVESVSECVFAFSAAGSDREDRQDASRRHGPLPDLLPQNEHPSWGAPHHHPHQAPRGEAVLELDVMRVANQLRTIGDEFNSTVIRRVVRTGMNEFMML